VGSWSLMRAGHYVPRALLALSAFALGACDSLDSRPVFCTDNFVWGLHVTVQDSATGTPSASGAQLIARDGAYADTSAYPPNRPDLDNLPLVAAGEREGTYRVTVRTAGFVDWERSDIVVTSDECHVRPVALTARLKRAP
jgi:hypothetical protein